MKNLFFLSLLLLSSLATFAQTQKERIRSQYYVSLGYHFNPNWEINSSFAQNSLPAIKTESRYGGFMMDVSYKSLFFLVEANATRSQNKQNNISNKYYRFSGNYSIGYNVVRHPNFNLKVGGTFLMSSTRLDIYDHNSSVNINNINLNNSGKAELNSDALGAGVVLKTDYYPKSKFPSSAGIILSYSRNVANAIWYSPNGLTYNLIKERGELFSVGLTFRIAKQE